MDIEASELGEEQTDTEEDLDSASAEMENTARKRTFTEKGKLYEKKTIDDMFEVIKRLCENILSFVEKNAPFEVIRSKFSLWMDKYEHYLEQHQNFMARIREQEKEEYIYIYEDREAFLCDFKRTIEKYFSDSQSQTSSSHRGDRYTSRQGPASHHSDQRSTHSSRSSILSNISSKKLAEEQQRVELELKKEALKKKRLLELAKINIQMDEEELDLSTGIAVSDAKTNILNKYELLENVKSETQSIRIKLNPHAPHFEPKVEKVERSTNKGTTNIGTATLSSTYYKSPITEKKEYITTTTNRQDSGPTDQNNNSEAITAIVKNLRKPMPEIKRFSGDPLEFRKFVRQFTVKIVQNSDTEDEKMNYLEQFTFGEAHKVVSGFSHLSGEYAYQAAMEQLEERYGNSEVIANAFIKKALEWPTLKAGDSKGLDEFSLFLIECENAAHSINALRILEYSENIKRLMCKLPFHLHDRWRSVVLRIKTNKETVQFGNFVKFVKDEAKKVNDLTYGSTAVGTKGKTEPAKNENSRRNFRTGNNAFATDLNREVKKPQYTSECSYCKSKSHKLEQCNVFKKLPTPDKYNHMKSQALCFGCLKKGHMTS
ncbi:unnamed protein product [Mytilus edulis]|uniref:Uncharacterized protein n=1 Tax=Mytilus edulis TaxID=6550 RepID=A0A8S3S304_MYTED|nr:unnamed protein product [Mytilus edulis]